jgi:hypothetical protein
MFGKSPYQYRYYIDSVGAEAIEGWVYHRQHDKRRCRVEVRDMSNTLLASGETDILRADLGGRTCGFRLQFDGERLLQMTPGRFMLMVDGIKLASTYFFMPVMELTERQEILGGLQSDRLERENEQLTRRVAELENQLASADR